MTDRSPGISQDNRISDEGLQRLETLMQRGGQISDAVLLQWIRRYGDDARTIIRQHGRNPEHDE